jgi:hypothetical protein
MSLESGETGGSGRKDARPPGSGGGGTSLGSYAGHGLTFAASILLFLWIGKKLDQRFHTDPWLTIGLMFLGAGLSFYRMYRDLMGALAREEAEKKERRRNAAASAGDDPAGGGGKP